MRAAVNIVDTTAQPFEEQAARKLTFIARNKGTGSEQRKKWRQGRLSTTKLPL